MGLLKRIKRNKENSDIKNLLISSSYDIAIYSIIFLIVFCLIRMGLRAFLNLNDMSHVISTYKAAVSYTIDNVIYISIISVIINIGSFLIFTGTIINNFRNKLIRKDNYKPYTVFITVAILILTALTGVLIIAISYNSILCISELCKISDLSFYSYELEIYNRLYLGLVINYFIWTLITIIVCAYMIKYLHNKKILIKETEKKYGFLSRIIKRKKK